jgi:hypothetical protein
MLLTQSILFPCRADLYTIDVFPFDNPYRIEGKNHSEDLGADGRIILELKLWTYCEVVDWFVWFR